VPGKSIRGQEMCAGYLIRYKDISAPPGVTGGPIHITDYNTITAMRKQSTLENSEADQRYCTVGIHIGQFEDDRDGMVNYGTLITPDIDRWMHEVLTYHIDGNIFGF